MITVDVSSDIDAAIAEVGDFFRSKIPRATKDAINFSAFDIRNEIVNVTWAKAFKVRNRVFPGRLFRVTKTATQSDLIAFIGNTLHTQGYDEMLASHAMGGVRKARGRVAIPAQPEKMRTATGRIRASVKPRNLKDTYTVKTGTRTLILKRAGRSKKPELLYSIVPSVKIRKTFDFYDDATATGIRVFPGYWRVAMNEAIAYSRFTAK
jgi:hypothetical protein